MNFQHFTKDEILALMVANAPLPSEDHVKMEQRCDMNRNPHNDSYKPPIRSKEEIIADYKINFARTCFSRLEKQIEKD